MRHLLAATDPIQSQLLAAQLLPAQLLGESGILGVWNAVWPFLLIFAGFSLVIFIHELGHFMAAKWADVRVERFAIGFFSEVVGFTKGETRYSFNILPLGGYVKMLGQEDFDDKENELKFKSDPRSFANKPVYQRMIIVSAGVVMNILLAALLFVIVFMQGKQELVTTIGTILPDSPASLAGLQPGDKILKINDRPIRVYDEIRFAVMLADPHTPLDFQIDRDGEVRHVDVKPMPSQQRNLLQVGIAPATTREVVFPVDNRFDSKNPNHLQAGDEIVAIRGAPVSDDTHPGGIEQLIRSPDGSPTPLTVLRADPDHPDDETKRTRHEVIAFQQMGIDPSEPLDERDTRNILGLVPLVQILSVNPGGRAELAGLREGDVIVKFGEHAYPTQRQIRDTVIKGPKKPPGSGEFTWRQRLYNEFSWNPERDIPIEVIRDDKRIALVLTPKIKKGVPLVGWEIRGSATDSLRIAEVLGTVHGRKAPAAECDIPKGALIEAVNDQPVSTWPALIELFRQNAGSTVQLRFKTPGGPVEVCPLDVPHDLYTKLGLTTLATIESINNQRTITVESTSRYHNISAGHSFGLYRLLKQALVESGGAATSVKVVYRESPYGSLQEAEVELNEDMIDPWLARVRYASNVLMQNELETLKASGPVDALVIGIHKTWYFVLQVYTMMERMIFSRSVGVEHLSGPVGIVKIGSDVARVGFVEFLFFLAIISANLAVINFLPLPIVDGGLMVFLIIEKIKGSPVSLKVQVATQVIGLCLIVSAFIFVTFQDILRLAG